MKKLINMTNIHNSIAWTIMLHGIRLWLGSMMIKSRNYCIGIFTTPADKLFFENYFAKDLHFPAFFIAFTMFIATITANVSENFNIDGGFTISYCLFACILILWGAGKYSLD